MKKLIISIVTCLMIVTGTISAVGALSIEDSGNNETRELLLQDNIVKNTDDNVRINTPLLDYFPFIYSTEKDREWFNENVIGKGDYKEGYLYAKERETNIVRQLVNQPVSKLREASDNSGVYFICDNGVYWVDYQGTKIKQLYFTKGVISGNILEQKDDKYLFFLEDNNLVRLNIEDNDLKIIKEDLDINSLYVHNEYEMSYTTKEGKDFYLNMNTRENYEFEYNKFFDIFNFDEYQEAASYSLSITTQNDPNFKKITDLYPNGSYFTTTGTACVNHNHCKYYYGARQCVGFGKYAYNVYAHQPSWGTIQIERDDTDKSFAGDSDVKVYFENCAPLTFVYINHESYEDHTITVVTMNANYITVYDCNWTLDCKVRLISMPYSSFISMAPSSSYYTTHKYSTDCVYKDSQTHYQYCDNSGCNGYRLEYHYSSNPASGICDGCYGQATINYRKPLRRLLYEQ